MAEDQSTEIPNFVAKDPRIGEFLAYWSTKRAGRVMPSRSDLDPIDIPKFLPYVSLLDVIPDVPIEQRYRVRLFGTKLVDLHERDWTGRSIFDVTSRDAAQRLAQAGEFVINHRRPWFSTGNLYWAPRRWHLSFEVLILPLSQDQQNVNMLIAFTAVDSPF